MTGYATSSDVAVRLGRVLEPTVEAPQVTALILDVSAYVDAFCRRTFQAPFPGDVVAVVCAEVMANMNSTPGIVNEQVGDVMTEYVPRVPGLSDDAMEALKHYRPRVYSMELKGNKRRLSHSSGFSWDMHTGIWP